MSNHDNESNTEQQDLEHYLNGNSELSTLYHSSGTDKTELPGSDLDAAILAAAKKEVGTRAENKPQKYSPFSNHYFIPLSTAATMLVAVALLSYFPEQHEISLEADSLAEQAAPASSSELAPVVRQQKHFSRLESESRFKTETKISVPKKNQADRSETEIVIRAASIITGQSAVQKQKLKAKQSAQSKSILSKAKMIAKNKPARKRSIEQNSVQQETDALDIQSKQQHSMILSTANFNDNQQLSASVIDTELVYDEIQWKNLTALEWRQRIFKIVRLGETSEAKKIITLYNKKFPNEKRDINDIVSELN